MAYQPCPQDVPLDEEPPRKFDLDVEILLRMTPEINGQDLPQLAARHLLVSVLKSQPSVHEVFFPKEKAHSCAASVDPDWFDFDSFSVLFVCQAIAELNDGHGIRDMIDVDRVYADLQEFYQSTQWKKLGFALYCLVFSRVVKDEMTMVPFSAFMDTDRQKWAAELETRVCSSQWIYHVTHSGSTDDEVKETVNLELLKIHLLHPPSATSCFHKLSKAIPGLSLNLVIKNYLGMPLDWRLLIAEVASALQEVTYPSGRIQRLTTKEVEVFYGVEVTEFVMTHARPLGLWTGNYAFNHRILNWTDRIHL
ncbi:hypothetical protein CAPTEDRAFT_224865 [Capitella teleta]|uniref:Uncharacterized protein n=1 Tax=Capitella teleta TaxID=283909 RepID=R7V726_CAPTE|nr:hypothetical protein CAPTEDRAFT_224865 [Capitella teleta]|eukprot:ELU14379.1 hypothetical protein CAPTEDRAFT_224865 [Capitella teleta]